MSVYLHDIPLSQAKNIFAVAIESAGRWGILEKENIPLDEFAIGRVLAEPVWAKISSPHYHASAMDGFAILSSETNGASQTAPLLLKVGQQAQYVDTGDPLPSEFNAVIMIENTEPLDEQKNSADNPREPEFIRIREAIPPWKNVRPMGEDMVATQLVLPAGHTLRPVDLGAIAGSGHTDILVSRKPKVAILPTGTELVEIGTDVEAGDIIEYNSLVLAAQIQSWGGEAVRFPITIDKLDLIAKEVKKAAETVDLILLNAGSSAGSEDFSASVVEKLGQLLVHGVAVRPGHPVILGMINRKDGSQIPIIGVPGYPVSAALTGEIFIEPLIAKWAGRSPKIADQIEGELTRKVTSPGGDDDYMRVVVGRVGDRMLVAPLNRGAGVISSLVRADGLVLMPAGSQGKSAGDKVKVNIYRNRSELEKTLFVVGSHDLTIDLLAQYLSQYDRRLTSSNVGSLGGLIALKRGEAHFSGVHLLDPESGTYNWPYIDQYLPKTPVKVISLVNRQQGLIVPQGNPKGINTLEDLKMEGIRYVNRQRGAGTRILLDYHLGINNIQQADILGYDQEEYTHLGVSAAIASGRADSGLGIAAAADALSLEFIPLFEERYDLIIPEKYFDTELLQPLFNVLKSKELKQDIDNLSGYDTSLMGTEIPREYS
jgi:putative molybdopterin biosynthesis protein